MDRADDGTLQVWREASVGAAGVVVDSRTKVEGDDEGGTGEDVLEKKGIETGICACGMERMKGAETALLTAAAAALLLLRLDSRARCSLGLRMVADVSARGGGGCRCL